MVDLEGPDDLISLGRAADIAGLPVGGVRTGAHRGHLAVERHGRDLQTTRRWLHRYIWYRGGLYRAGGAKRALPADYQTPQGEEPIL